MRLVLFTLSAILLFTLAGRAQTATGDQAHASVAAHTREAREHAASHHQRHRRHHHHRRHGKA